MFPNKSTFLPTNTNFGASTSFGQAAPTNMFPTANMFQAPSTSSFMATPAQPTGFGSTVFGQQTQPSTSGLFGSNNAFGQNKTAFGFGTNTGQTGLFGQQPQPAQPTGSTLFQTNTPNLFGSNNTFGATTHQTGTVTKFSPVNGTDTLQRNGVAQSISTKHHCITCMKEYENKSLEELRFEDYSVNRKGPQQQSAFGATAFGGTTNTTAPPLFGQTDNKQGFGQQSTFGQTPAFGQTAPAFGVTSQPNVNLFSKTNTFGAATNTTPGFAFNPAQSTSNPFSATQTQKQFSVQPLFGTPATTQAQPAFGTGLFGQPNTQTAATNLFQKPAQPTTGFTPQTGFTFTQPASTQPTNLFQAPKPTTGFGMFGQTSTAPAVFGQPTQTGFNNSFIGRPAAPAFGQTNPQNGFMGVAQVAKTSGVFTNMTTGGNLFNNNTFQQPQNFCSPPQTIPAFPPEPTDEHKNMSLLASDLFTVSSHIRGLEPKFDNISTNPLDLKALVDHSKKREAPPTSAKIKVSAPHYKLGTNLSKEFFETTQPQRGSYRSLVIRKFKEPTTNNIFEKYRNDLIAEAETVLKAEETIRIEEEKKLNSPVLDLGVEIHDNDGSYVFDSPRTTNAESPSYRGRIQGMKLKFDSTVNDELINESIRSVVTDTSDFVPIVESPPKCQLQDKQTVDEIIVDKASPSPKNVRNPAGVILTKSDYFIYPPLSELSQFLDENGNCYVTGLTIGRRGHGSVYFHGTVDIANMNLDEIVHFEGKHVDVYPDESTKPPLGQGLNRKADITLKNIFPKEEESDNYVTDVNRITNSNFVYNLAKINERNGCNFLDYHSTTGTWSFQVEHFTKYGLIGEDLTDCRIGKMKICSPPSKSYELDDQDDKKSDTDQSAYESVQSSLIFESEENSLCGRKSCTDFVCAPRVHDLADPALITIPEKITSSQRVYTDLGIHNCNTFKIRWDKLNHFYDTEVVIEPDLIYYINQHKLDSINSQSFNTMMPNLDDLLTITLEESQFSFNNGVPTLMINKKSKYLEGMTKAFEEHSIEFNLSGKANYLTSILDLCTALWGNDASSDVYRRRNLSDWLAKYCYDLSENWIDCDRVGTESETFETLFQLLSFYKIKEACQYSRKNKLFRLSMLLSQFTGNEHIKYFNNNLVNDFAWKENVILDEFKKLSLLLAGSVMEKDVNVCDKLDWLRCFAIHLWYIAPSASSIEVAYNLYKKAFEEEKYATKPKPYYADIILNNQNDLIYHILSLFVDGTYQMSYALHPESHTENLLDYRFSWFLLQLFQSLDVGLLSDSEISYIHTTFSWQLETMCDWKWAVFILLYLENNVIKKDLISKVLHRNLALVSDEEIEKELVQNFKLPAEWIHDVKSNKAGMLGDHFNNFQQFIHLQESHQANDVFLEKILPELFVNDQLIFLKKLIEKMEPFSDTLINWENQVGLLKEYLEINEVIHACDANGVSKLGITFDTIFDRINNFPIENDKQKLCVQEVSKKCALLYKIFNVEHERDDFQRRFVSIIRNMVIPPDHKQFELLYVLSKKNPNVYQLTL